MDKKSMTYELRIKTIIDEAQKNLGTFEKQLKDTWENGSPPKHMSKSLEGIRARLTSLQEIAKKGVVDGSDLAMAESDYKAFNKIIHDLSIEFKLFTAEQKKAMLSEEEQRAMHNRAAAVKEYNEELKKNREILEKRKAIEAEKAAVETRQQPTRRHAETTLEDYGKRKENLDKTGPVLSSAAKEYASTLDEQSKLLDDIKIKQAAIENLKKAGRRTDRENSLTITIRELEELEAKYKKFESLAGKSEYDAAMAKYAESVAEVEKALEEAKAEISAMDDELEVFDKKLEKLPIPNTQQALADLKNELKELGIEGIEDAETIEEIEKAIEKLNGKALQRVDDNLEKARKELEQLGEQGKKAKKGIDQATQAIKEQEEAARQQEAFEGKIKQFLGMAGAAQVMRNALRNAMSTIKDLDATMTEMAVVTDLEIGDYWKQLDEHAERASNLGASINDVYKAETLYYQQGLKTEEVVALSTETIKMATIAGLDSADATNKMTAALRGFNMELNETSAQRVADVYSELAAITAADVDEISSAMTKTASIASSAGMEFETTAAFLSQIIETTRESAETAGTAMKTVIARFQELKKAPSEIGEVDGEIVDANKIETALRSVGVALRDSSGQFRDLDDVFLELSSKWDTLDTNTQRYIATIAAGSRQQSRFIAMMSDYGRTQELVTAATNSAGASQRQFDKTIESFDHKLNALKTAWQEFSMGILESDLVKFGVDVLTKFLEIVNKATGALDGLGGSITKIMTVVALFKLGQKVFDKFKNPLMKFFTDIVNMGYRSGFDTGKAFAEGVKAAKDEETAKEKTLDEKVAVAKSKTPTTLKDKAASIVGIDKFKAAKSTWGELTAQSTGENGEALPSTLTKYNNMVYGQDQAPSLEEMGLQERRQAAQEARQKRITAVDEAQKEYDINYESANKNREEAKKELEEKRTKFNELKVQQEGKKGRKSNAYKEAEKDAAAAEKKFEEADNQAKQLEDNLKNAKDELIDFDETEQEVQTKSQEGWEQVGQGIQNIGGAVAGVGIAVSALGGVFDSLGLSEVGEAFSTVGNILMIVGGAISAIGTLVPIVTKILVASGYSVQSAWWPLLVIGLALAALIGTIMLVVSAIKAAEAEKLENRMKAAAQATEDAKKAAQEAKETYDELLSDRNEYDEMQKTLKNLTYGTKEWKNALVEANNQVLELIRTYPELAKYMSRGEDGQLTIINDGWDELITKQQQIIKNTQYVTSANQVSQWQLEKESIQSNYQDMGYDLVELEYGDTPRYMTEEGQGTSQQYVLDDEGNYIMDETGSAKMNTKLSSDLLIKTLEDMYVKQGKSQTEVLEQAEALADLYAIDEEFLREFIVTIGDASSKLQELGEQTENLARANLTAAASEETLNSIFGNQAIDAFAQSVGGQMENTKQEEYKKDLANGGSGSNIYKNDDEFKRLAEKYKVTNNLTGNDEHDLKTLYAAMMGYESIEKIPEAIAADNERMLKEISAMNLANERSDKMDEYVAKLEALYNKSPTGEQLSQDIAGIFSDEGLGMTKEFAESLLTDSDGDGQINDIDKGKMLDQAKELGYDTVAEWAEALNKTEEDLYTEAEQNAKKAIRANEDAFDRLNGVLKSTGKNITKFGQETDSSVRMSVENSAGLADKMFQVFQTSNEQMTTDLKNKLDTALEEAGPDADKLASALNAIDWQSAADWDGLQETIEALGITWTDSLAAFVTDAKVAAQAVDIIDFEKLAKDLGSLYDTMRKIQSGEQGRAFDSDVYEQMIAVNKDLAKDFTQIGDKFYYLGGSMNTLTMAIEKNTSSKLKDAEKQLTGKKAIADEAARVASQLMSGDSGERALDLSKGTNGWTKKDKADFLQEMVVGLSDEAFGKNGDAHILSYITGDDGKSLGMSMGMNFDEAAEEELDLYLENIKKMMGESEQYWEDILKMQSDARISNYAMDSITANITATKSSFESGDDTQAVERAKALQIQAVDSGLIAESIMAQYGAQLDILESKTATDAEKNAAAENIMKLQSSMEKDLSEIIYNQEGVSSIIEMQNRVAEALYNQRQKEIDKLSEINQSVNEANDKLLNKVQEQIDIDRQEREKQKIEKDIAANQSKLAYLMADTSGAGALEAQALQQQITEQQENYQDQLIDQQLQKLSDDNAAAAEQRERQIAIMEAALAYDQESGALSRQAEQMVNIALDKINNGTAAVDTDIFALLSQVEDWAGMSEEQFGQEQNNFITTMADAAEGRERIKGSTDEVGEEIGTNTDVTEEAKEEINGTELNAMVAQIKASFEKEYGKIETDEKGNLKTDAQGNYIRSGGNEQKRDAAIAAGISAIKKSGKGYKGYDEKGGAYDTALQEYLAADGTAEEFKKYVTEGVGTVTTGIITGTITGYDTNVSGYYDQDIAVTIGTETFSGLEIFDKSESPRENNTQDSIALASNEAAKALNEAAGGSPSEYTLGLYNGSPYVYQSKKWRLLFEDSSNSASSKVAEAMKKQLNAYETGGLADFTGPAWLDGTKSHPELVLNARDTQNFIQLKDILAEVMSNNTSSSKDLKSGGDNYYEIQINVDEVGSDYDVEQMAQKIRSMIYEDATYRNVNTISRSR